MRSAPSSTASVHIEVSRTRAQRAVASVAGWGRVRRVEAFKPSLTNEPEMFEHARERCDTRECVDPCVRGEVGSTALLALLTHTPHG